jgi:cytochrome P450 monooxygenase-3
MSLLQEVIHAPSHQISFLQEVYDRFLGRWTNIGVERDEVVHAVRMELTKNIPDIVPLIQDEARYAFDKEIGNPKDWTSIPLYPKMLRLVALLSGRVFVGQPLSRDEDWIRLTINFTINVVKVSQAAKNWNILLRPLVAPFLPEVRNARNDMKLGAKKVEPIVNEILSSTDSINLEKGLQAKPGHRGAFIAWILNHMPEGMRSASEVGISQMLVSFASIHTTSSTASMIMLDLAARPEYIQPLRDEVEQVIREEGGEKIDENGNPYLSKSMVVKLKKLDSFVKESQRCSPLAFYGSSRRILADYTFSNGLKLPKGTDVGFPMWALTHSPETNTYSPEYNAETGNLGPEVFDGFRFSRLREMPGRESRHQAVTTGIDSLNFGHGPHACPGRFFAIYEIKLLVLEFIRNYDIRIAGDESGKGGEDLRPKDMADQLSNNPNYTAMLEIKKRES